MAGSPLQDSPKTRDTDSTESEVDAPPPCARFGLTPPASHEERLLNKVMRDMCFVAGTLLHTAAKILNKALQLSNIPRESFDEALRRTMLVINSAREEIARLILPKRPTQPDEKLLPSQIASQDVINEAARIVEDILLRAKIKIEEAREKQILNMQTEDENTNLGVQYQAKNLVEEVIMEAQRKVVHVIVEDFLRDLLKEAQDRVQLVTGDWHQDSHKL